MEEEPADPLKDIKSSRGRELDGRRLILCVTGSVASIEVPSLARELMRHGAEVNVVMSEAAEKLVRPETLEWATGNPVIRQLTGKTEHVRLAGRWKGKADLVLIAPCTEYHLEGSSRHRRHASHDTRLDGAWRGDSTSDLSGRSRADVQESGGSFEHAEAPGKRR